MPSRPRIFAATALVALVAASLARATMYVPQEVDDARNAILIRTETLVVPCPDAAKTVPGVIASCGVTTLDELAFRRAVDRKVLQGAIEEDPWKEEGRLADGRGSAVDRTFRFAESGRRYWLSVKRLRKMLRNDQNVEYNVLVIVGSSRH